jgi:predicted component of type VI protein secretion system
MYVLIIYKKPVNDLLNRLKNLFNPSPAHQAANAVDTAAQAVSDKTTDIKTTVEDMAKGLMDKTDIDEKMIEQVKTMLEKTDLDEKGLALLKQVEGMLGNPMFSGAVDGALAKLNMTKTQLQEKISMIKSAAEKMGKQA